MIWFAPDASGEIVAVGIVMDRPWMNVFARSGSGGHYLRYGFHISEERWAYDSPPQKEEEILGMLKDLPAGGEPE
jgi:hypothetical protein